MRQVALDPERFGGQLRGQGQLPFLAGQVFPGAADVGDDGAQVQPRPLRPAGVAPHRPQDLLQALGDGAERLAHLPQHVLLVVRQAVGFQAAAQQVVGPDQQVLDVVGVRAGHDADAGVELRFQFQRLLFGGLRGKALLQQSPFGFLLLVFRFLAAELVFQGLFLGMFDLLPGDKCCNSRSPSRRKKK